MIRILIINDRVLSKLNCKKMLENNYEMKIHECTAGEKESLCNTCNKISPDIVIVSYESLDKNFDDKALSMAKFVVVHEDNEDYIEGLNYVKTKPMRIYSPKVYSYITTDIKADSFNLVIRCVLNDICTIKKDLVDCIIQQQDTSLETAAVTDILKKIQLTDQETIVIKHVASGMCNRQIASNLFLSEGRIKNIVSCVLRKLELNDRTQLAIYALQNNIY